MHLQILPSLGLIDKDFPLIEKYYYDNQETIQNKIIDYFGMVIDPKYLQLKTKTNTKINELPFPDDSIHADTIEYIGILKAIEQSKSDNFTAIELGCGWAPWLGLCGILSLRLNKIPKLIGVEASSIYVQYALEHMIDNKLESYSTIMHHAIWINNNEMFFDTGLLSNNNWGARPTIKQATRNYEKITSITILDILSKIHFADILHMDVQGVELDVLNDRNTMIELTSKIKRIIIGTHSKMIEANLLQLFKDNGWFLEREKSCVIDYSLKSNYKDMVKIDGCQIWVNPVLINF
jgi:FkbM family methyltransferase